jgi:DNA-binding NtrC family response regulator
VRILLVEDDRVVRTTVRRALEDSGHTVLAHEDGRAALAALQREPVDLLLTDIRLPGLDGLSLFRQRRQLQPDCATILVTAYGSIEDAVAAMREGAHDYITKPFDIDELALRIDRIEHELALRRELAQPGAERGSDRRRLAGRSPAILQVLDRLEAAAEADVNVVITGETGTGKELCAHILHRMGRRAARPFIHVNCAAIPSELLEAEMFGHERGAFTGALRRREGRMLAADGGTLFLDEIGELTPEHQAKLLRAIDSGTFEPVGSDQSVRADLRIISATNRELRRCVEEGSFRRDLFFRLDVVEIRVPPLRERRGDLRFLVTELLREAAERRGSPMPALSSAAIAALLSYSYPGNVRELLHALEHGLALARGGSIDLRHLPQPFQAAPSLETATGDDGFLPLAEAVKQFEESYIQRVVEGVGGKREAAARVLGISRKSLWQKLKAKSNDEEGG